MNRWSSLGWDAARAAEFAPFRARDLVPGRVVEEQRDLFRVALEHEDVDASLAGRLRHEAVDRVERPAVGDWVALTPLRGAGRTLLSEILPRRSVLMRKEAGRAQSPQVVASNVDVVLIATSANLDFNARRLERYAAFAWESGAQPVVCLTKSDLCADVPALEKAAEAAAPGAPVVALSAVTGEGLEKLSSHLACGRTAALVGSSGVGKSTLVNRLLGAEAQATRAVRDGDDRGVHTTTARRLLLMPSGAALVDTPGMRELGLLDHEEGLDAAFSDVLELAGRCRFSDCAHASEPGCAVKDALATGAISPERWASFDKLRREMAYLARRDDPRAMALERARWKQIHKANRNRPQKGTL